MTCRSGRADRSGRNVPASAVLVDQTARHPAAAAATRAICPARWRQL